MKAFCVCVLSHSVMSDFCNSLTIASLCSTVHGNFHSKILQLVAIFSPGTPSDPGTKHVSFVSPTLAGGSLRTSTTWEPQRSILLDYKTVSYLGLGVEVLLCKRFLWVNSDMLSVQTYCRVFLQQNIRHPPSFIFLTYNSHVSLCTKHSGFISTCIQKWEFPGGTSSKEDTCLCRRHKSHRSNRCREDPGEGNENLSSILFA